MVVLMHACVTYSGMGSWFYVERTTQDIASTLVFGIYQSFAQAFFMGLLFFLAGTLVPAAYDRKGFLRFVGDRAVRLGVPSLVFMLILNPLTNIIRDIGTGGSVTWAGLLPVYRDFVVSGRFLGASGPLWFAVALLVFSVVYALVRLVGRPRARPRAAAAGRPRAPFTTRAINIGVACVIALIAVIAFLIRLVQPLGTSVMNMQLGYFSSYVVLFVAGLWAGRNGFLQAIPAQLGRTWLWVSIGVGLPLWMILQGLGGALEGKATCFRGAGTGRRPASPLGRPSSASPSASACSRVPRAREREEPDHRPALVHGLRRLHLPRADPRRRLDADDRRGDAPAGEDARRRRGSPGSSSIAFAWLVRKIPGVGRLFA